MSRPKQSTLVIPPDDDPGGNTPYERFDNMMKRILSASKADVDRGMAEFAEHNKQAKRRRSRKTKRGKKTAQAEIGR
jgi:hypothetical protein